MYYEVVMKELYDDVKRIDDLKNMNIKLKIFIEPLRKEYQASAKKIKDLIKQTQSNYDTDHHELFELLNNPKYDYKQVNMTYKILKVHTTTMMKQKNEYHKLRRDYLDSVKKDKMEIRNNVKEIERLNQKVLERIKKR